MKKIYTRTVFEFDPIKNQYVVNENESQYHYIDDDAPIAQMKGGGGGKTVTQSNAPWGPQGEYLKEGFKRAADAFLYNNSMPQFSDESKLAQDLARRRALEGNPLLGQAQGEIGKTIAGDYLYGGEGFNAALDAAKNKIIPQVESKFASGGRYGSGLARSAEAGAIGDAFAGLYGQERDRQLKASALGPEIAAADWNDIDKLFGVGKEKEAMSEAQRLERRKAIAEYLQAVSGNYGSEQTGKIPGSGGLGPWAGAAGGALSGFGMGGPWGALGGGILGLLGSL